MSVDLAFWQSGRGTPEELYDLCADGEAEAFEPSAHVLSFRAELVARWPELSDDLEPLEFNPDLDDQEDLSRYLLITMHASMGDLIPSIVELAVSHGLSGYDPQHGSAFA